MFTRSLCAIGAIVVAAGTAQAGFFDSTQSQSMMFGFPLSPNDAVLTFDKFDTMGGTRVLKAVGLEFEGSVTVQVTAENDSTLPAPEFAIGLTGFVDVSGPAGLAGVGTVSQSAGPVSVGPSDGVPEGGPDFHDFGLLSDTFMGDDLLFFGIDDFIGPGSFDVNVHGEAGFAASGTTDSAIRTSNFRADGEVTVIYYYNIIPSPGAAALMGLAGLVGLRRRR